MQNEFQTILKCKKDNTENINTVIFIMPHITKFGKYVLERFDAPLHCDLAKAIDKLCNGFGDHYKNYFGPDFIERMTNSTGGAIVSVAYLEDSNFFSANDIIRTV